MVVLLGTVHGSHLYGTSRPGSDLDYFQVVADRPNPRFPKWATQTISGDGDKVVTDLTTFVRRAAMGVPQYLEAMWSRKADVDLINDMRMSFRPDYGTALKTYARTVNNFNIKADRIYELDPARAVKFKKHTYRLNGCLIDLAEGRRFNPTLDPIAINLFQEMLLTWEDPRDIFDFTQYLRGSAPDED